MKQALLSLALLGMAAMALAGSGLVWVNSYNGPGGGNDQAAAMALAGADVCAGCDLVQSALFGPRSSPARTPVSRRALDSY